MKTEPMIDLHPATRMVFFLLVALACLALLHALPGRAEAAPTLRQKQFARLSTATQNRRAKLSTAKGLKLRARGLELQTAFRLIARTGGLTVLVDHDVKGRTDVSIRDLPAAKALIALARAHGLTARKLVAGGTAWIICRPERDAHGAAQRPSPAPSPSELKTALSSLDSRQQTLPRKASGQPGS